MTSVAMDHRAARGREHRRPDGGAGERLASAVLRVPLFGKLLGANLLLVSGALLSHYVFPSAPAVAALTLLLIVSFTVSSWLAWLALRPISALEATAERVSAGDFSARAPVSRIADRQTVHLTETINRLLDRVETDRARIHYLAGRGVRARDIERESVARELRDSFAQTLSGIGMQLGAVQLVNADARVALPLDETRAMIQDLTEDMRSVAETLYPGTLSEFGLLNAIEALARRVSRRSHMSVEVKAGIFTAPLSRRAASALYRVAEEALRNVEQHAQAEHVKITLSSNGHVTLEIDDDGRGTDMMAHDPLQAGLGLFSARAVLALSGGELQISSGPGLGTRITASVPIDTSQASSRTAE